MDCLFCKIAAKEITDSIVHEDDTTVAFLDINPRAPGHTLIIPKDHCESILDLKEEQIEPVFSAVKRMTGILKKALAPDGFTIGVNHGRHAGQVIDHLHIHVIPRWKDDGGTSVNSVVLNQTGESLESIKEKILKASQTVES
jgi:histidine triad (HIT) family protein